MLYLITGANGAGKTLNTLKWVRDRSLKENRPVAHNGRFEPVPGGEISTWKTIDVEKWQDEPDGTIFVIDECHNDFPLRPPSAVPPEHVRMLAEHRRRGFDFYLVTQHPQNLDAFVRRLIGSPGWHRHLKRTFGADLVSVLEWPAVNPQCEKNGSGRSGSVSMQAFPKDVYGWYRSASLHTGKKKIPRAVYFLAAAVIAIPALGYFAVNSLKKNVLKNAPAAATSQLAGAGAPGQFSESKPVITTAQFVNLRRPRITEFEHTAPIYDEVTKPVVAPYPAACVQMGPRCECYTQQATLMRVAQSTCTQIVKYGFFVDWAQPRPERDTRPARQQDAPAAAIQARSVPIPQADQQQPSIGLRGVPEVVRQGSRSEWASTLSARNDSVRSVTTR